MDIVDQLREHAKILCANGMSGEYLDVAADEIERLRDAVNVALGHLAERKKRETIRAWVIIKPDGDIVLDSDFKSELDAWKVGLGWPSDDEIEQAKKDGYRAVMATVII